MALEPMKTFTTPNGTPFTVYPEALSSGTAYWIPANSFAKSVGYSRFYNTSQCGALPFAVKAAKIAPTYKLLALPQSVSRRIQTVVLRLDDIPELAEKLVSLILNTDNSWAYTGEFYENVQLETAKMLEWLKTTVAPEFPQIHWKFKTAAVTQPEPPKFDFYHKAKFECVALNFKEEAAYKMPPIGDLTLGVFYVYAAAQSDKRQYFFLPTNVAALTADHYDGNADTCSDFTKAIFETTPVFIADIAHEYVPCRQFCPLEKLLDFCNRFINAYIPPDFRAKIRHWEEFRDWLKERILPRYGIGSSDPQHWQLSIKEERAGKVAQLAADTVFEHLEQEEPTVEEKQKAQALEGVTAVTEADIEDIGKRANIVKSVFDVSKKDALIAIIELKEAEIGRDLTPLKNLFAANR